MDGGGGATQEAKAEKSECRITGFIERILAHLKGK
jgi:hypothetical protein